MQSKNSIFRSDSLCMKTCCHFYERHFVWIWIWISECSLISFPFFFVNESFTFALGPLLISWSNLFLYDMLINHVNVKNGEDRPIIFSFKLLTMDPSDRLTVHLLMVIGFLSAFTIRVFDGYSTQSMSKPESVTRRNRMFRKFYLASPLNHCHCRRRGRYYPLTINHHTFTYIWK